MPEQDLNPSIVFVTQGYPPIEGGVSTSTQRVAQNLVKRGCRVIVLSLDYSRPLSEQDYVISENDEGVEIRRVGPFFKGRVINDETIATHRRRIFDQMELVAQDFDPDLVLSFFAASPGLLAAYLAHSIGCPHVVSLRGNDIGRNIFSMNWIAALSLIVNGSARIACVNEHLRRRLLLAFPKALPQSVIIANGVELPRGLSRDYSRAYIKRKAGWTSSDIVVVFLGTLREKKGALLLLRAFESICQDIPLRLLIVGPELGDDERLQGGQIWDSLKGDGFLHVTGQLSRTEALLIAGEGDIIVMPSIDDGMANSLLEGMLLGLCPVVSDLFADIVVAGECGWVTARNDLESLTSALLEAASSSDQRSRFGRAARARVGNCYTAKREAEAYLELFREVLRDAPPRKIINCAKPGDSDLS